MQGWAWVLAIPLAIAILWAIPGDGPWWLTITVSAVCLLAVLLAVRRIGGWEK